MKFSLSLLSDQRLQDAGGAADALASAGHEGAAIIAGVAGDAVADELDRRKDTRRWGT